MGTFFESLGALGILLSGGLAVRAFIQKKPKKPFGILAIASVVIFLIGGALSPQTPTLAFADTTIKTDDAGLATVTGEINHSDKLTVDGEKVKVKDGKFSYDVTLKNKQAKKITFVATKNDVDKAETVTVKPSKAFIASISGDSAKTLKKVETALTSAESKPSQKNYDEAATLVSSLSKEYDKYDTRLQTIKENIPVYEAVESAENSKSQSDYDKAAKLVATATLNKADWTKRLATVKETIAKKEQETQLVAAATTAVEKAEQEPTNQEYYNDAVAKIDSLPTTNKDLKTRIATVKKQFDAHQAEEQKVALEAQKQAEANEKKAKEAADQAAAQAQAAATEQAAAEEQQAAAEPASGEKLIKGSRNGIYHTPGSRYYDQTTNPVIWFSTVEEAVAAGYRAPKQ